MAVQFKNNLPRITSRLPKRVSEIVKKTAFAIESEAKQLAPVDTGALRNSIQTHIDGPLKAEVGSVLEYAEYQEYGTRHQHGTPFLTPAADKQKKEFQKDLRDLERSLK
jgi:HK97 gp10 family phage protein